MRKLKYAYGSSCQAKLWYNRETTWEDLVKQLSKPIITPETMEEYKKMKKQDRDNAKDKGGFVAGYLKDGKRKLENLEYRSMLTLDMDEAKKDFLDSYQPTHAGILYSTHSHTTEKPRYRIVIPLSRDVTPDEYNAISRLYAAELGIEQVDECSFRVCQLMYYPTCSKDAEFVTKEYDGVEFDVDKFLEKYPNYKDVSTLPYKTEPLREKKGKKVEDPLVKKGLIGAFNRTYTMHEAINLFLSDVYKESDKPNRFDYIPADSIAGVVIYDDKFAYSHHATDPAYGELLNAYDLVRIHKGYDTKQMNEFVSNDDKVKLTLINDKREEANKDFTVDWRTKLKYIPKTSLLENSVWNLMLILENDKDFEGIAYNDLASRVEIIGSVPWDRPKGNSFWKDSDDAQMKALIDVRYGVFSTRNYEVAFTKVVSDRHFHPIRNYLDNLPHWDGVKRVEDVFIKCLEADDTDYTRTITRKVFAAAVARIYEPGIKFDCIPVLDGEQGIGKSTIFKDLVGQDFYCDTLSLTDMGNKTAAEKLQGYWIVEIGELAGMKKAEIEKVRAFLSTQDDKYRPSYGRTVESHPRQCIIIATVNGERGYLRDITGNRRYWIIKVKQTEQRKKWKFDKNFIDQFWAEAKAIYESGEELFLKDDILLESQTIQKQSMEQDDRVGYVEEYLNKLLPEDWDTMKLYERRNYLYDEEFNGKQGVKERTIVSNMEIWCECFGNEKSQIKSSDSYAIAALMLQIPGWERTTQSQKLPIYGKQRIYRKVK